MKTDKITGATLDKANAQSIIELANQRIPDNKFKGLTNLLEPHEQPSGGEPSRDPDKSAKRG